MLSIVPIANKSLDIASSTTNKQFPGLNIVPLVMILVVFYILIIRPQQKQAKLHKQMLLELKQGDKIITNGGIVGIIKTIDDSNNLLHIVTGADTIIQITKENIIKKI